MSCYCKCSVTLLHCAVDWSVVCDCGIAYTLNFFLKMDMYHIKDETIYCTGSLCCKCTEIVIAYENSQLQNFKMLLMIL